MPTEQQIQRLAQSTAQHIYDYLISTTQVDRVTAQRAAADAANKAMQSLELALHEALGVL